MVVVNNRLTFFLAAVCAVAIVCLLYLPGTHGALYYDDYNALNGLADIDGFEDAKRFVVSGTAGPLGRPIALATYLAHAKEWPDSREAILSVNVAIHILNAILLWAIAVMILRLRGLSLTKAYWIALSASLLWAVQPIVASATLIAIQRMATLAALFGLLGIAGFVAGYWIRDTFPRLAFGVQFGSLGLGTLLGLFTKESAALIPVFALLIDTLLVGSKPFPIKLKRLSRLLLFGALVLILWYLSPLRLDWFANYESRGWSPWERLQYQVVLLWEYVRLGIAPLPTAFGPFHDHRSLSDFSHFHSIAATSTWIFLIGFFLWIFARHRNPWPLFALLWFLTSHLLESTVLNLELVFEHRNYLAFFGCSLALAVAAGQAPGKLKNIVPLLFGILIGINAASLYALTSLWGNQRQAAEQWAERYPGSARAALHAAFIAAGTSDQGISELNVGYIHSERKRHAVRVLDRTAERCSSCADVRFQALLYACSVAGTGDVRERFEALLALLETAGRVNISVADGVFVLDSLVKQDACTPLEAEDVLRLIQAVTMRGEQVDIALRTRMLFVAAKIYYDQGRIGKATEMLSQGEEIAPQALPILQFQVFLQKESGELAAALAAISRRREIDRSGTVMTDEVLAVLEQEVVNSPPDHPIAPAASSSFIDRGFME